MLPSKLLLLQPLFVLLIPLLLFQLFLILFSPPPLLHVAGRRVVAAFESKL